MHDRLAGAITTLQAIVPPAAIAPTHARFVSALGSLNGDVFTAASDAFGVGPCFILADPGLGQSADQAAGRTAGHGQHSGRRKPTGCDDRANSGNGHDAEAGEQASETADGRTNAGPGSRSLSTIIDAIRVAIDSA